MRRTTLAPPAKDDFYAWVTRMADPLRAKEAYWHLQRSGRPALPAVLRGISDEDASVRVACTQLLDRLIDEESMPLLVCLLDDPAPMVRWHALHALACDRCKQSECRLDRNDVLPEVVRVLREDPDPGVRAMACETLGKWALDPEARGALQAAHDGDPHPAVRRKASWYLPGGRHHARARAMAS